jgi:GDPmannose 4,6-dehydratase
MKRAFITGITGQDGSYLAELLIEKGYEVFGLVRRSSSIGGGSRSRIDSLTGFDSSDRSRPVHLVYGDLNDSASLDRILREVDPDEVYNLAGQSHPRISFEIPEHTADIDALGPLRILQALHAMRSRAKFYQAGSSELFGKAESSPQNEQSPFRPCSPYAVAKLFAYWTTVNYRQTYGLYAVNGILFNHESPRRGENFVTRKITIGAVRIKLGLQNRLVLGDLDARRDWGFAGDYMQAVWLMLQQSEPDDYVIATGNVHSVKDFLEEAFGYLGMDWRHYVETDPKYFRPADVASLVGDASKAAQKLRWRARTSFRELVRMMTDADMARLTIERRLSKDDGSS